MKKKSLLIILLFILLLPLPLKAIVKKSEYKYVTDDAELLTQESIDYIVKYSDFLDKGKKIDFYVVTVKNLEGKKVEEYSDIIFSYYGVSPKGILVLISKEDRKMRIQVGQEMGKHITKKIIDKTMKEYFIPYMEREEWNDGIINGYTALYKTICEEYGIDASTMEVSNLDFITKYKAPLSIALLWIIAMFSSELAKFFKKTRYHKEEVTNAETIWIAIVMILNIIIISLAYILDPIYVVLGIIFEAIMLYSLFSNHKEKKVRKRKKIEKKRRVKKVRVQKRRRNR